MFYAEYWKLFSILSVHGGFEWVETENCFDFMKETTRLMEKRQKSICSPMREKFRGKKGFEVLRISPRGLTQQSICYLIAGKLFSSHYS